MIGRVLRGRRAHSMITKGWTACITEGLAMAQLRNYFLGPFQVTRDDQSVIGFESDKGRALLAYLLIETARPHRREALAALFWPDQTDRAGRQSLRQALYTLRHTLSSAGT